MCVCVGGGGGRKNSGDPVSIFLNTSIRPLPCHELPEKKNRLLCQNEVQNVKMCRVGGFYTFAMFVFDFACVKPTD